MVTSWARDNAAALRSLAGRVSSHDTDVHDALAEEITTLADTTHQLRHPTTADTPTGRVDGDHPVDSVGSDAP